MPRLYILTGGSRGLGAALAERLVARDHHLLLISRRPAPPDLDCRAVAAGATWEHWPQDLGQTTLEGRGFLLRQCC